MKVLYVPFPSPPSILYCNVEASGVVLHVVLQDLKGYGITLLRALIISGTRNLLSDNEHARK